MTAVTADNSVTIVVRNVTGGVVWSSAETVTDGSIRKVINLSNQPAGVYVLTMTGDNTNISKKIVVN
jgi:hypothetical protein